MAASAAHPPGVGRHLLPGAAPPGQGRRSTAIRPGRGGGWSPVEPARAAVCGSAAGCAGALVSTRRTARSGGWGPPFVHVTVHDPRAYGALRRGSPGLAGPTPRVVGLRRPHRPPPAAPSEPLGPSVCSTGSAPPPGRARPPGPAAPSGAGGPPQRPGPLRHRQRLLRADARPVDDLLVRAVRAPGLTLAEAQTAKLDRICEQLDLWAADHLVEIGTGWGASPVTPRRLRLSRDHHHDLGGPVRVRRQAGRRGRPRRPRHRPGLRLPRPRRTYDKLVSVEMIEAVDWRDHTRFFRPGRTAPAGRPRCPPGDRHRRPQLRAGKRHADFVRRFFPGGCLPSVGSIVRATRAARPGRGPRGIGRHYAETLRAGGTTWTSARPESLAGVGLGLPPALGPVPGVLRGRLPGAPHQ